MGKKKYGGLSSLLSLVKNKKTGRDRKKEKREKNRNRKKLNRRGKGREAFYIWWWVHVHHHVFNEFFHNIYWEPACDVVLCQAHTDPSLTASLKVQGPQAQCLAHWKLPIKFHKWMNEWLNGCYFLLQGHRGHQGHCHPSQFLPISPQNNKMM